MYRANHDFNRYICTMGTGLVSPLNQTTEVSTIIMWADQTALDSMLANPTTATVKEAQVYNLTYISSTEKYFFEGAGLKNSGKSTKDFAKQSYKFSFNEFQNKTTDSRMLFNLPFLHLLYITFANYVPDQQSGDVRISSSEQMKQIPH